ncbi:hypothetical protein Dsin_011407 [Dipteronia sinensis]|uniref:Reverse transcriptase domain-containing protein n=1 Tax=Dipteronia sinensis TaxID=43782 RepID=A0AAE0AVJ2_9ROSI|nr:hypothetical protein Dsin_011407 [Dipteronia sinensis]
MRGILHTKYSAKEVNAAVFDLNPTKASGLYEFQAIFFQKSSGMIRGDVTKVCLSILNGFLSIREFNDMNVLLIPKVKNHVELKDFCLISLCSVIYKIVTKVMVSRLKGILPNIISPYQFPFVLGRQIYDNFLVAFESLHSLGLKKSETIGQMALKLDMSKAYDKVEWAFLTVVIKKMNFPS